MRFLAEKKIRATSIVLIASCFSILACSGKTEKSTQPTPPKTEQKEQTFSLHNTVRSDLFHWLSDEQDPKTLQQIQKENVYARQVISTYQSSDKQQNIPPTSLKTPELDAAPYLPLNHLGWEYGLEQKKNTKLPVLVRKKGEISENIFNPDVTPFLAGQNIQLTSFEPSPDGRYLLAGVKTTANGQNALLLFDLAQKELRSTFGGNTSENAYWGPNSQEIYLIEQDIESGRSALVKKEISKLSAESRVLFQEQDDARQLSLSLSASGQYLVLNSFDQNSNEILLLQLQKNRNQAELIIPRASGIKCAMDHQDGIFFLVSNHESPNMGIYTNTNPNPNLRSWTVFLAPKEGVFVQSAVFPREHVVVSELVNNSTQVRAINRFNQESVDLLPIPSYKKEDLYYAPEMQYSVSVSLRSPVHRAMVWRFDLLRQKKESATTPQRTQQTEEEILSRPLLATSSDGVTLPLFLYYKKGTSQNGQNPVIMTLQVSRSEPDPFRFNPLWPFFIKQGISLVVVQIRNEAHPTNSSSSNSPLIDRQNGIYDLIACAESLVNQRWAHPDRLAVMGSEEGAWTIAAAMNLRPSLFACSILHSPVTDPITMLMDSRYRVNTHRLSQWGNPADKEAFDILLKISPYDQLEPKDYPAVMLTSYLNQPRVPYWHALKWGSKLRMLNTAPKPTIMYTGAIDTENQDSAQLLREMIATFISTQLGIGQS